jgi:hypothetical protein
MQCQMHSLRSNTARDMRVLLIWANLETRIVINAGTWICRNSNKPGFRKQMTNIRRRMVCTYSVEHVEWQGKIWKFTFDKPSIRPVLPRCIPWYGTSKSLEDAWCESWKGLKGQLDRGSTRTLTVIYRHLFLGAWGTNGIFIYCLEEIHVYVVCIFAYRVLEEIHVLVGRDGFGEQTCRNGVEQWTDRASGKWTSNETAFPVFI